MKNQTEIERLEQKIMDGGNVSPAELADATRNSDAEKRIAQLTAERTIRTAQSDVAQLAELKAEANRDLLPRERISVALKISEMEKNINANK
jgi:cell division septum initiation protein DivIVA